MIRFTFLKYISIFYILKSLFAGCLFGEQIRGVWVEAARQSRGKK